MRIPNPFAPKTSRSRFWIVGMKGRRKMAVMVPRSQYPTKESALEHVRSILMQGNPPESNTGEMPLIYGKTERIEMTRTSGKYKGQPFYHKFTSKTKQYGIPGGTRLVLPSGRTKKLNSRGVLLVSDKDLYGEYIV
jgi:hypothetical protein